MGPTNFMQDTLRDGKKTRLDGYPRGSPATGGWVWGEF